MKITLYLLVAAVCICGCTKQITASAVEKRFIESYDFNLAGHKVHDYGKLDLDSVRATPGKREGFWNVTWRTKPGYESGREHTIVVSVKEGKKGGILLQVIGD